MAISYGGCRQTHRLNQGCNRLEEGTHQRGTVEAPSRRVAGRRRDRCGWIRDIRSASERR